MLKRLWKDETGQTLLEYTLVGALVVVGAIVALAATSTAVRAKFQQIVDCLNSATTSGANC